MIKPWKKTQQCKKVRTSGPFNPILCPSKNKKRSFIGTHQSIKDQSIESEENKDSKSMIRSWIIFNFAMLLPHFFFILPFSFSPFDLILECRTSRYELCIRNDHHKYATNESYTYPLTSRRCLTRISFLFWSFSSLKFIRNLIFISNFFLLHRFLVQQIS